MNFIFECFLVEYLVIVCFTIMFRKSGREKIYNIQNKFT